jgi:hypothetical protein
MLREGARCEVLRYILGHANIDVTQNIFARAGGTNEWMQDMVGGRENANCLRYRDCTQNFPTRRAKVLSVEMVTSVGRLSRARFPFPEPKPQKNSDEDDRRQAERQRMLRNSSTHQP